MADADILDIADTRRQIAEMHQNAPRSRSIFSSDSGSTSHNRSEIANYYISQLPFLFSVLQAPELELTNDEQKSLLAPFIKHAPFRDMIAAAAPVIAASANSNHSAGEILTATLIEMFDDIVEHDDEDSINIFSTFESIQKDTPELLPVFGKKLAAVADIRLDRNQVNRFIDMWGPLAAYSMGQMEPALVEKGLLKITERIVDDLQESGYPEPLLNAHKDLFKHAGLHMPERPEIRRARLLTRAI